VTGQAGDAEPRLTATALAVGWTGRTVADRLDLCLAGGTITVVAGPNGAGKSTLLKTLARQLKPLSGQVELGGQRIWDMEAQTFAQQVAYVPQSLEPGQDLTVNELVALGRNPHQRWWSWAASAEDRLAVRRALEQTETWALKDKYLSTLSGGERRRALIATALAQQARLLLLDEPTAHLDFKHQMELCDLLDNLRRDRIGILVVLHDLNLMSRLADHILLLGKPDSQPSTFVACGSPQQVLEPPTLRAVYEVEVSIVDDPATGRKVYTPIASAPGN
jgi:iron complex transport system ATP-binding protein